MLLQVAMCDKNRYPINYHDKIQWATNINRFLQKSSFHDGSLVQSVPCLFDALLRPR